MKCTLTVSCDVVVRGCDRALLSSRSRDLTPAVLNSAYDKLQSHVFVSICDSFFCSLALEVSAFVVFVSIATVDLPIVLD